MGNPGPQVGAVILAAGQSRRMGQPKQVLPWGNKTVIEQVISVLLAAKISPVVVVTGGAREQVELILQRYPVQTVYNPHFAESEMVSSLQEGIRALGSNCVAFLVVLADQPTIEASVIRSLVEQYAQGESSLVIPSYQMRRGHPWLVDQKLWPDLLSLRSDQTMRDFLNSHREQIVYVNVDSPGILKDMDTPEDYRAMRPS